MKKLPLIIFTLLFLFSCQQEEDANPFYTDDTNDEMRNTGSALSLWGETYVAVVFVSETGWNAAEKQQYLNLIDEAESWMSKQAKHYDAEISFTNEFFGLNDTIVLGNIPDSPFLGDVSNDFVYLVTRHLGYANTPEFVAKAQEKGNFRNVLMLVIADKAGGRPYALPYKTWMNRDKYFLEGCVLYPGYRSSSFAHEMLHLFGAWDLYAVTPDRKDREERAKKEFPRDIMLYTPPNINEVIIDRLTAWRVGISNRKKQWYDWFRN